MDKTIYREQALFGHSSRRITSPKLSYRKSDLDFNDVFGGPPRRSSLNEEGNNSSYSFDEQISGLREKPVFGEDSPSHRQKLSDDFFDDIFRGDSSSCSTPRKMEQGVFPSSPGSGVLSPKQLSRSGSELFAGPSSLLSPLSLSTKGAKEIDFPTFGSPTSHASWKKEENALQLSSSDNVSSYNTVRKTAPGATNLRTHSLSTTHRQSPLSQQNSCREKPSVEENKLEKQDKAVQDVKNITVLEEYGNCGQFHFSIYKWANKGVSVMMPVRGGTRSSSKELVKNKGIVRVPSANILMKNDLHKVDDFSTLTVSLTTGEKLNQPVDYAEKDLLSKQTHKEEGAVKSHNATEKKSTTVREFAKKEDKLPDNQIKGKVSEFIKKFDQEISPNPGGGDNGKVQIDGRSSSIDNEEDQSRIHVGTNTKVLSHMDQLLEKTILGSVSDANDSALEMKVGAMPIREAPPENFNTIIIDIEEESNCEDFNDLFQVEELCQEQEQNEKSQTNQYQEDIHNHDAEIRKWCYGKEGNIRSLLSTLQYILWPDSGWKPIRLIDIIEGPSVKRAYQRALLCLHPDKLQQKEQHHIKNTLRKKSLTFCRRHGIVPIWSVSDETFIPLRCVIVIL